MLEVARDGIEPPTPAFSGLPTDNAKGFRINGSSWPTESYMEAALGSFGMVWAQFALAMFPYCSRDSSNGLDMRHPGGAREGSYLHQGFHR